VNIPFVPTGWLYAAAFVVGLTAGAVPVKWFYQAQIARTEAKHAQAQASAERQARERLQAVQERGDTLTALLNETEAALATQTQEVSREIARRTTGRSCLDADLVRLLNQSADSGSGAVPPPPGQPAAEDGAAATDTDIAGWIAVAQNQYETCRGRLGALIDFEGEK